MFGLSELKQTRVYRETLEEGEHRGKLKAVLLMLAAGLGVKQSRGFRFEHRGSIAGSTTADF